MRFVFVPCALFVTLAAAPAAAQPAPSDRAYAHVNVGGQVGSNGLDQPGDFPLFDESASFSVRGDVGGGVLFDVGGGVRVWRRLYGGVSYSRSSDSLDANLTGQVPHPHFHDQFRPISGTVSGLEHTEHAVHLQAVWRQPISILGRSIDAAVFAGPTFFSVQQDAVTGFALTEPTPTLASVTTASISEGTTGFHLGADLAYRLRRRISVGLLLRFARGSIDLPVANRESSLDVGGFQVGAGARYGF
jgi:hypothetical protein